MQIIRLQPSDKRFMTELKARLSGLLAVHTHNLQIESCIEQDKLGQATTMYHTHMSKYPANPNFAWAASVICQPQAHQGLADTTQVFFFVTIVFK